MNFREALRFGIHALWANKTRTFLTALGLVIGNASVILVVTISLTSRNYVLEQISGVGSNLVYGYFEAGNREAATVAADFVKIADVEAVRAQLGPLIKAASGVMFAHTQLTLQGKPQDVAILGSDEQYARVRNLIQLAGRPLDEFDVTRRQRVALLTKRLAEKMYGSQQAAIGQMIKLYGLQFTVIGVFREKTESFGLSELSQETVLIPYTVLRYFVSYERIDPIYVQARSAEDVEAVTERVRQILESRHRPGARYYVANLTGILDAARNVALILSLVLFIVSAIALVISGIGIMNIMLVTVTERTREIGLRMSVGAKKTDIMGQFLTEAMLISASGGLLGVVFGVAVPLSVSFFVEGIELPVSPVSVLIAFVVSFLVGIVFGIIPANRAARLNPTEALRYE